MTAERLWFALVQALERHGWTLLAAAALLLVARARLREFSQRAHERRALADANEPSRVAALQRETARIREAQQLRLAQSTAASKKNTRKSKPQ